MGQKYSCPRCNRKGTLKSLQKKECRGHPGIWIHISYTDITKCDSFELFADGYRDGPDYAESVDIWRWNCCCRQQRKHSECHRYSAKHELLVKVK